MNKYQKFNVCLVKPDNYIHSYAFLELGELIYFSLKELGFDVTINFNKIEPDRKNILIGCHLLDPSLISGLPSSTVILNTEQIYNNDTAWNSAIFSWAKAFEVWDYSERNIEKLNAIGIQNVRHFKIGFQKELARLKKTVAQDVDVLFYGSLNDRRKKVIDTLISKGIKVKTLFGVYGQARDEWVTRSKIVLNHHFYNSQIFEVVRVFYLLTNSAAVVGEVNEVTSIDPVFRAGIYAAKYEDLAEKCIELLNNDSMRQSLQETALDTISKYPQKLFTSEVIGL